MTDQSMEHATRSPSGAHAWRRCCGKINAEAGKPDTAGIDAAMGTLFHDYAEKALSTQTHPLFLPLGEERVINGYNVTFDETMAENMVRGYEFIQEILRQNNDAILFVEQRVSIEPWTLEPGGFGTSDVCIVIPSKRLIIVFDWKYGNIAVSPIRNDQLMLYGLGCWESLAGEIFDWNPEGVQVHLYIEQPRVPGAGGLFEMTMEELLREGDQIMIDAAATYSPNAPRVAGEKQCAYCRARGDCKELAAYNFSLCQTKFSDIEEMVEWPDVPPILPDTSEWTPEHRAYVWLHRKTFISWFDALHDQIVRDMRRGVVKDQLVKIVTGRAGDRKWREEDKDKVKNLLSRYLPDKKKLRKEVLITPAESEKALIKMLGKKMGEEVFADLFRPFYTQSEPKPKLVPYTTPGEEVPPELAHFDAISAIEEFEG